MREPREIIIVRTHACRHTTECRRPASERPAKRWAVLPCPACWRERSGDWGQVELIACVADVDGDLHAVWHLTTGAGRAHWLTISALEGDPGELVPSPDTYAGLQWFRTKENALSALEAWRSYVIAPPVHAKARGPIPSDRWEGEVVLADATTVTPEVLTFVLSSPILAGFIYVADEA